MSCLAATTERTPLGVRSAAPGYAARVLDLIGCIEGAPSKPAALTLFREVVECFGADAAWFLSFIRDDATSASYRFLLACDPVWATEYARQGWSADDPWLRYAAQATEPIRASELTDLSLRERTVVASSANYGFRSALIAPTPSSGGQSRLGVLCIGSSTEGFFEDEGYRTAKLLARCLAMELHGWWLGQIKTELIQRSRISDADLALLRYEEAGHSSKAIAADLGTEAKTIDCRFQRVCAKLGAANRRAAVRIAKLYGLI
jgi:DNA-binding CsgD family transcriptional regulator